MSTDSHASAKSETTAAPNATRWKPLRIWPPATLLVAMIVFRFLPSLIENGPPQIWMSAAFGPALCGVLILVWWLAASRATWRERLAGFVGVILASGVTLALIDKSMRGPAIIVLTVPLGTAAFALGAILCYRVLSFHRTVVALVLAFLGFGVSTMLRSEGFWGNFAMEVHLRWSPSAEDTLLRTESNRRKADVAKDDSAAALAHPEWPGFRGPNRDGQQHGPSIAADWNTNPPQQVWKIAIGPGWSSFALAGPLLFTQEQRGSSETIACYAADSGLEIWTRQVESRFDDPLGGPGPRATPTLADGALYVLGATGFLLKLDPLTGDVVWQQDLREVADCKPPMWGFSSSPLVVDSVVVVYAGGAGVKAILAFNIADGKLQWSAAAGPGDGNQSYSSPQLATLENRRCVLMLTSAGLQILDPATGASRLNYEWPFDGYRALQPQLVDGDSVLLPTSMGVGTRRIRVVTIDGKWQADEVWTSRNLKPDFNDLVVYQGHAYGFDATVFTCLDLTTGQRNWKGGRYGKGQVLLQEESGLLLVMGEQGEVVLLKADPKSLIELGRFQAITGKTWNHPVLIGDRLYVRNSQEAACYRLPLAPQ